MENYTEIFKNVISMVQEMISKSINKAAYDKTFRAIVIDKKKDGVYEIEYKRKRYNARCKTPIEIGSIVTVCAPQNKWNELYIQAEGNEDFILNYLDKCVTLSDAQTLTNKRYNGMAVYRVAVDNKKNIYIKNTSAVSEIGTHVGGFLFMEQNGECLIAALKPNGWTVLANGANWSCSYSNYQWTISAQSWSYGWFIPFSDNMNFTITYD